MHSGQTVALRCGYQGSFVDQPANSDRPAEINYVERDEGANKIFYQFESKFRRWLTRPPG